MTTIKEVSKEAVFNLKVGDRDVSFKVGRPTVKHFQEAQKVYNRAFREGLEAGLLVRAKLDEYLTKQGLWDSTKEVELKTLQAEINRAEVAFAKGGIKLQDAYKLALDARKARFKIRNLLAVKRDLDETTVEAQSDNARFNYLVSATLVYNETGKPYFKDMEDYLNRADSELAGEAASKLANLMYGLDADYESGLPENKFLKKFNFVDDKYRLVKDGILVDEDGKRIDENGRYINESGEFVDRDGNRVGEDGNYVFEFSPFLDDNGKELVEKLVEEIKVEKEEIKEDKPVIVDG